VVRRFAIFFLVACAAAWSSALGDGDDGYDSHLAQSVRAATQQYRLVLWAVHDGYVQTTDYIPSFGTMYTNHARFDPQSLAEPTVLVYDLAGRLVACGYQYLNKANIPDSLKSSDVTGWYEIPRHVHYNIVVDGVTYYAQQPWEGSEQPTASLLIARKLMPANATLLFAFVHPHATAIIIWAWMPNSYGLFDMANPALP
jgi:hypothetical protein